MKLFLTLLSASFFAVQSVPAPANAQPSDEDTTTTVPQQTRALFRRGLAAYNSGQVETARQLFLQAWVLQPSADVAMELAQTEMDLGRYVDAAEHLDYALHNFTPSINEKMRNIAKQAHTEALRHVARIIVTVNLDGAEVLLNGRVVGKSPITGPLYAEPGNCVVQARFRAADTTRSVSAEPGRDVSLTLTLKPPPAEAKAQNPPPISVTEHPALAGANTSGSERSLVPVIVGGTLTVLGVSAGLALRVASNSAEDDARNLSASVGTQGCTSPTADARVCASLRNSVEKSDRERNWSTASFVIASAALVGTAVYWLWPRNRHSHTQSSVTVGGAFGVNAGSLVVSGAF